MSPTRTATLKMLAEGMKHHTDELKKKLSAAEKAKHTQAVKNIEVKVAAVHAAEAKDAEGAKPLLNSALARDVETLKEELSALKDTVAGLSILLPTSNTKEKPEASK